MLRRILIWFGIAAGVIAIYAWLFGVQTVFLLEERYFARESPVMWEVPVELVDTSVSESPGQKLSYLGCDFEVPWNDLDEQKTRRIGNWEVIAFHSGKKIVLMAFPAKERVNAVSVLGQKLDVETMRKLKILYGEDTLQSDYAFTRAVLGMTPGNISIFSSRKEAVRSVMLLLFKQFIGRDEDPGIYDLRTKDFRGFQYGNPRDSPREIVDELFSDNGRCDFTFPCRGKGSTGCPSQAEINRVIQSARLVN